MSRSSDTVVLSLRVSPAKADALDKLSSSTDRSRQWLLEQALEQYLLSEAWQIEAIQEGVTAADAGDVLPHDQVREWLGTWGKKDERKPPQ